MTELASRANAAAMPAGDPPAIKSTSCQCPMDSIVVDAFIFGDILANISQEPASRDGGASDKSLSGETCGPNLPTWEVLAGLSQAMTQLIASFLPALSDRSPPQGSSTTPAQAPNGSLHQLFPSTTGVLEVAVSSESPAVLRAASVRRPGANSNESPPVTTSDFFVRSGAIIKEENYAFRAQGGAELLTGNSEIVTGQGLTGDREGDDALARTSGAPLRSKVDAMPGTLTDPKPAPIIALPIHVTALETYFPAMIVRTAVELAAPINDVGRMTTGASPSDQSGAVRVKILTFDVHPEALGPLTVRMRINGKQIEIAIDVRTERVRATLAQTREAMVEALAGHGLRLETPDIRLAASVLGIEPKPAMQDQSANADAGSLMQDQGQDHHDRRQASTRHGAPGEDQSRKARGAPYDVDKSVGIYL